MMNDQMGFVPPHNFEAEQSVLGGLMLRPDAYHDLTLTDRDFYSRPNQIVFSAISALVAARQPVDLMTVSNRVGADGLLDDIGGMAYLIEIIKNTPSAANVTNYGAIVRQASERRFAVSKLHDCIAAMMEPGFVTCDERFSAMDAAISEIDAKRSGGVSGIAVPASEIVLEWCDLMEERLKRKPNEMLGFSTGIESLDELLFPGGISKTALVCVGARPKAGKTTVMAAICNHVALNKKQPVAIFSLEMNKTEILEVMLSQAAQVSGSELKGATNQSSIDKAYSVVAALGGSPLLVADMPNMGLSQIQAEARRLRRQHGQLGLVAVDYLTLMRAEKAERNDLAYGAITKGLKQLAKEMGCPVILLTQLNRGLENRVDKRPFPSDSRDTGQIEQDCDVWIGLYRDEIYNENTNYKGVMELLVRLNRGGGTGTAYCSFKNGVLSSISKSEIARMAHLAELDDGRNRQGAKRKTAGWDG